MGCKPSKVDREGARGLPLEATAQAREDTTVTLEEKIDALTAGTEARHAADLPKRLMLGLTLDAMWDCRRAIPTDAMERCNEDNAPRGYPRNTELNGYVNQFIIMQESKEDGLSVCERRLQQGMDGVGIAAVFVSWYLNTPLDTLLDALEQFLLQHPTLSRGKTHFWCCDFVIRQGYQASDEYGPRLKPLWCLRILSPIGISCLQRQAIGRLCASGWPYGAAP